MNNKLSVRIKNWLGLSDLQYELFKTIHNLQQNGEKTNPSNIQREYEKKVKADLKQPSLFVCLRELSKKGIIIKGAGHNYFLNPDGIKASLSRKRKELKSELSEFDSSGRNIERFLDAVSENTEPNVTHHDVDELIKLETERLKDSKKLLGVSNTSMLAWTNKITDTYKKSIPSIKEFVDVLQEKVLVKKDVEYKFITRLETAPLKAMLANEHGEVTAVREMTRFLENMRGILKTHENVKLSSISYPGLHFSIPYREKPREVFLIIRDAKGMYMTGIHIYAPEIASELHKDFKSLMADSVDLRSKQGQRLLDEVELDVTG